MALTLQQKLNDMVGDIDSSIDVASHMAYAHRELIDALPANLLAKHVIPETAVSTHTVSDSTQDHRVVLVVINAGEGKRPARMETYDRFADFFDFSPYGPREGNQAFPGVPGCVGVFSTIGWPILRTFENRLFWAPLWAWTRAWAKAPRLSRDVFSTFSGTSLKEC